MEKGVLKKISMATLMFSLLTVPIFAGSAEDHAHHLSRNPQTVASGANPLKEEMALLNSAFQNIVSAVALGDGESVHKALETLHGRKEKTLEGVRTGEVKLPKNPERIKDFEKMDQAYHADLEALASAAQKNDQPKMLSITKKLLDGCVNCHKTFRK